MKCSIYLLLINVSGPSRSRSLSLARSLALSDDADSLQTIGSGRWRRSGVNGVSLRAESEYKIQDFPR